jgi:SAM-dependent methyltransferase
MNATDTVRVDPSNAEAYRAWDGVDGAYWADNEELFDASLGRYDEHLFAACAIAPAERVLDIGCGTGHTTRLAARAASSGSAIGVDLSARMLAVARSRATEEELHNVEFVQADAQIHPFPDGSLDLAVGRTGTMFFGDPIAAFANIHRALRPGGRLVQLVWQPLPRNPWVIEWTAALAAGRNLPAPPPDAPGPFSLADPERARTLLTAAGYAAVDIHGVTEPIYFGPDAARAHDFMAGMGYSQYLLRDLDDSARSRALTDLRASVETHHTDHGVLYPSAAWIIAARRR